MRLLLDEHFSPEIARQLRDHGHDVIAAQEQPDLRGLSDRELLSWAAGKTRAVVTEDVADFAALHREYVTRDEPHPGIIFTSAKQFPRTRAGIGRMVAALDALLASAPAVDALRDRILWLESSSNA
ncbi:MAG: DUF5615 family PIN-like protein [Candidatus Limnocylindria bacterium]